jgi:hypothetical protein
MDSTRVHNFTFNEAISFMVECLMWTPKFGQVVKVESCS